MFSGVTNLEKIYTPYSTSDEIALPSGQVWKKTNGTIVEVIPGNLKNSIKIIRADQEVIDYWNFSNFSIDYLSLDDYARLVKNLDNLRRRIVLVNKKSSYGACYGMSVWVYLINNGILKTSDIKSSLESLRSTTLDDNIESAIMYYQIQQCLPEFEANAYNEISGLKNKEILKKLENAVQEKNVVISIRSNGSHAVVGYGYKELSEEEKNITVKGKQITCTKCILIYDSNNPTEISENSQYNIYYNDDGEWCIPGSDIYSEYNLYEDYEDLDYGNEVLNPKLEMFSNDNVLNLIDYRTGNMNVEYTTDGILLSYYNDRYKIEWGSNSADISNYNVINNTSSKNISVYPILYGDTNAINTFTRSRFL